MCWSAESTSNTVEKVQTVLSHSMQDPLFNLSYIYNGCFVRAHALAAKLNDNHIPSYKIFLSDLNRNKFYFPHQDARRRPAEWLYHVVVAVEVNETVYILDPTLSGNVLELNKWISLYKEIPQNVNLNFVVEKVSVKELMPEIEFNQEFLKLGGPFSKQALEYIEYEMENLFFFERADLQEHLLL